MSAACCTGDYRDANMFTIIHFNDRNVSEGFYMRVLMLNSHVCKVEDSE